jgi:hypothetical protein
LADVGQSEKALRALAMGRCFATQVVSIDWISASIAAQKPTQFKEFMFEKTAFGDDASANFSVGRLSVMLDEVPHSTQSEIVEADGPELETPMDVDENNSTADDDV